jgi:hypothetical protein
MPETGVTVKKKKSFSKIHCNDIVFKNWFFEILTLKSIQFGQAWIVSVKETRLKKSSAGLLWTVLFLRVVGTDDFCVRSPDGGTGKLGPCTRVAEGMWTSLCLIIN